MCSSDLAVHVWQLALATNSGLDAVRERLQAVGAADKPSGLKDSTSDSEPPRLQRNVTKRSPQPPAVSLEEELGRLRTIPVPSLPKQKGEAEFFVLFSRNRVEDAQFLSGSESLKMVTGELTRLPQLFPFPDDGPEKIPRRGILSCFELTTPTCQMVLLLPANTTK